jgi:hypothetical protein
MARFLKLGQWLPMSRLGTEALAEANEVLERWDVPHEINGQPVPRDIDNRDPRWWRTRDGHRLSGRITPNEIALGAPSLATPIVIGLIPVVAMVTTILTLIVGWPAAVLGFALMGFIAYVLAISEGIATAGTMLFVGGVLPFVGTMLSLGGAFQVSAASELNGQAHEALPSAAMFLTWLGAFLSVPFITGMAALVATGSFDKARVATLYVGGILLVNMLALLALPHWAQPSIWFFAGAGLPWAWSHLEWTHYIDRLAVQDMRAQAESAQSSGDSHMEARKKQAEAVMRDTSPVFEIGVATGAFDAKLDGYAPDKGSMLCTSAEDCSMHFAITGTTGTRKSSFIRAFITQWVMSGAGGMLVLDEKDLPGELRGLKGYTLIEPGVTFAPLEGLNPTETTSAIFGVGGEDGKSGNKGNPFFDTSAKTMWLNGAVLVQALVDLEKRTLTAQGKPETARRLKWTIACIRDVVDRGVRADKSMVEMLDLLVDQAYRCESEGEQHMLESAIQFWRTSIPSMDAETRSNVLSTLLTKIDPMISHPDLVAFAYTEKSVGFNLNDIRHDGLFGVNLPAHVYGFGGLVISSLTKERGYKLMRERGSKWAERGEKRVLFVVDEAADLVSDTDARFLKVARGYGACCMYAVQNKDAFVKRLGSQAAAETFNNNFRAEICMESSSYTYEVVAKKLGHTRKQVWQGPKQAVNFKRSLKLLSESALLDPNHPGAARMRTLLRRGAGVFKESNYEGNANYSHDRSSVDAVLALNPIEHVDWVEVPLFEKSEFDSYLAEPGIAVATVMRGGVRRRDVIQFKSLREFPPELLAAQPAPTPSAPPSVDEQTSLDPDMSDVFHKRAGRPIDQLESEPSSTVEPSTPNPTKALKP